MKRVTLLIGVVAVSAATAWGLSRFLPEPAPIALIEGGQADVEWINPCAEAPRPWSVIRSEGQLVVALPNDSTSYFLYRGMPRGFDYELLKAFADENDLTLTVRREESVRERLDAARVGDVDLVGGRLPITAEVDIAWSQPLYETAAAVVQRIDGARQVVPPELRGPFEELISGHSTVRARPLTTPDDLLGREVWMVEDSGWLDDVVELEHRSDGDVEIVTVQDAQAETLVKWVGTQRIPLAVAEENVSVLSASHYDEVVVKPALGSDRPVAFAAHCGHDELLVELDDFIDRNPGRLANLYDRYFLDRRGFEEAVELERVREGRLSAYDDLFRKYAPTLAWDWRLLAAQSHQESRFKPNARSWAGAEGLMQLMPAAARQVGIRNRRDPEQSIRGGVAYLAWLEGIWEDRIADPDERLRFVLASYNAGAGHVEDARRLAEAFGDDATRWAEVAPWLIRLSDKAWYTQPEVQYGFCRGLEPTTYVARILERYDRYQDLVPPMPYVGEPDEELLEKARSLRGIRTELAPELAFLEGPTAPLGRGRPVRRTR